MTPNLLFALLLIVVLLSNRVIIVECVELNLSDEPNQLYQVIGDVERVVWEPQRPFASEMVKLGKPVVLTQTTVDLWNARKEWKPSYLIKKLPKTLTGVKRSTQPILYHYKNDAPLLSVLKMNPPTSEKFDMFTKEFFQKIKKIDKVHKKDLEGEDTKTSEEQANTLYYYLSKNLQEIDSDLKKDLSPNFDWLQASNEGVSSNLWIGAGGVTAHAHYDSFHNFFVQFYGKKKFLLFPPSQWASLQLHPRLHPFYRQSQLNFSSTCNSWSKDQTLPQALEVTLSPGDLLYLPPYWFHHVIAVDLSISINVWSDSEDFTVINSVLKAPLPFEDDWSPLEKAAAVRLYFEELDERIWVSKQGQCTSDEVCSEGTKVIDSESFYCKLFNVRYGKLREELDSHSTLDFTSCQALPLPAGFSMKDVERGLNNVVPLIDKLSSTSVKEILVGNFIEDVIAWAVSVQNVSTYLLHCLCAK